MWLFFSWFVLRSLTKNVCSRIGGAVYKNIWWIDQDLMCLMVPVYRVQYESSL